MPNMFEPFDHPFNAISKTVVLSADFAQKFRKAKKFRGKPGDSYKYELEYIGLVSSGKIFATSGMIAALFDCDLNGLMEEYKSIYMELDDGGFKDINWEKEATLLIPNQLVLKDEPSEWTLGKYDGRYAVHVRQNDYNFYWLFNENEMHYLPAREITKHINKCNSLLFEFTPEVVTKLSKMMKNDDRVFAILGRGNESCLGGWIMSSERDEEKKREMEMNSIKCDMFPIPNNIAELYLAWKNVAKIFQTRKEWKVYGNYKEEQANLCFRNGDLCVLIAPMTVKDKYKDTYIDSMIAFPGR